MIDVGFCVIIVVGGRFIHLFPVLSFFVNFFRLFYVSYFL